MEIRVQYSASLCYLLQLLRLKSVYHEDCSHPERWLCKADLCKHNILKQVNDLVMQDTLALID